MLYNKTTKKTVSEKTRIADSFFKKFKGLMFSRKPDYALIFELESESRIEASVHNFFVFYPIDLVYLNSEKRVIEIRKNFKPFTPNFTPKKPAKYFIEFAQGKIDGKIAVGDELDWKN